MLPFTSEVFLSNFGTYNAAIWPAQIVAYALGALALAGALRPFAASDRITGAILAAFWLWTGAVYHGVYFASINFAAPAFALVFVIQGLLFLWTVALRGRVGFRFRHDLSGWTGIALAVFALGLYPLLGRLAGHVWPEAPVFGVAPCPVTIFTLGMLLLIDGRTPWHLAVIPLLWSLVGATAVWLLDVPEDASLLAAGLLAGFLIFGKNQRQAWLKSESATTDG